jgi:cytochrome b involved in lipid metabolism
MEEWLIILLVAAAAVLLSGCAQPAETGTTAGEPVKAGEGAEKTFTLEEISRHSSAEDCWLAISGKVYDVSGFISSHPGGTAILQGCGKDATGFFETRPMGSGTPHSPTARELRENYYIGELG